MVQIEVSNHFWWDMTVMSGMGGHHMTKHMNGNADGFALSRKDIEPVQDEAQECLYITGVQCPNCSVRRCIPLEKIAFRLELLIFGIAACGEGNGTLTMSILEEGRLLCQKPPAS